MQSFLLVLLAFSLFHSIQSESKCPEGSFQGVNGKCYKGINQLKTWHQAEVDCYLTGGHLASVTDTFTNAFISSVAKNVSITAADYWLGGTSNYVNGSWAWSNFDQFKYTNWIKGPLNNTIGYCLSQLTSNTLWASESCANEKPYVCEYSQIPCAPAPCPPGWFYANALQKCYLYQNSGAITWNDALTYCQNINSSLASIHSLGENIMMSGGCVYLAPALGTSNWHVRACNNQTGMNGFICEVAAQNQTVTAPPNVFVCPNGTTNGNANGKCYQTFDQPNTWYQAEANCYASGGHLASITDPTMNTYLAGLASGNFHSDDYWLGAAQYFDGSYSWMDDYSFNYTFWAPGQPSNSTGYCLTQSIDDGAWIASDCTMTKPYICEYIQALQARCPATIPCQADLLGISTWLFSDSTEKCYLV
uniref:C-type lectin domain-containing protein n=1 Tax=Acrobeloides nanus TaxID=290746 RepID=A0A914BXJ3_9BILA